MFIAHENVYLSNDNIGKLIFRVQKTDYYAVKTTLKCFGKLRVAKETFVSNCGKLRFSLNIGSLLDSEASKDKGTLFEIVGNSERLYCISANLENDTSLIRNICLISKCRYFKHPDSHIYI